MKGRRSRNAVGVMLAHLTYPQLPAGARIQRIDVSQEVAEIDGCGNTRIALDRAQRHGIAYPGLGLERPMHATGLGI